MPVPPSTYGALAGATVLANLSASNITIGKAGFRRELCASQSARTIAGYVYTAAGMGESTTDLAWDGQALIYENGDLLAESDRFATGEQLIFADLDLDRIASDRASTSSYGDSIHDHRRRLRRVRRIEFSLGFDGREVPLRRRVERFPYVPADPAQPQRALRGGLQHPGARARDAVASHGHRKDRDRRIRRARFDTRADRRRPRRRPPRAATRERARVHDAGVRHQRPHARQRAPADAHARGQRLRARHPPGGDADAPRSRPSGCRRRAGLRRHVRERAGGRAHLSPVPAREPSRRARARDRRPVRARARLGDVRRRRPDVALPRQRLGAEDADPVPAPVGDRHRSVRLGRRRGARVGARDRDLARARAAPGDQTPTSPAPTARASSGPTRSRTSSSTTSFASATRRARSRIWPTTRGATAKPGAGPT